MSRILKIVLATVGIFILIVAVASMFPSNEESVQEKTTKVFNQSDIDDLVGDYAQKMTWGEIEESFMEECNLDGTNNKFCQCGFDVMKSKYTKEEYLQISLEIIKTGRINSGALNAMSDKCLDYYIE